MIERDVFHTGSPDTTLWEFKHGNGNFKRGDLAGLREIKRRASRHALVHRENSFSKPSSSQPGTPVETIQLPPESAETRMTNAEHSIYELSSRLQRSEESAHLLHIKNQATVEALGRLLQVNQDLARAVLALAPPDSPAHRDGMQWPPDGVLSWDDETNEHQVTTLQSEIARQADTIRSMEEPHDLGYGGRGAYFGNVDHGPPLSPRQLAQDDSRRNTLTVPSAARSANFYRPPVPSSLSRRSYGSIGDTSPNQSSPLRNAPIPPPPPPHPLSNLDPPSSNLARRHTTADIRAHGWQPGQPPYPQGPTQTPSSGPWPSSPGRTGPEDQRIRESLSSFSLQSAARPNPHTSQPTTPPPPPFSNGGGASSDTFGSWSWGSALRDKNLALKDSSVPPTRRGSMAHILNPSDTAERSDEDDDPRGDEDRKRKRLQ